MTNTAPNLALIAGNRMLEHLAEPLPATDEQLNIFHHIVHPGPALVINACAGSSKTTTMVEGVNRLVFSGVAPNTILCLAFNKSIADTLAERMPQGVQSRTMNALGHGALKQFFGSVRVDTRKVNRILAEVIPGYWELQPAERRIFSRCIETAKMQAIWPTPEEWESTGTLIGQKIAYPTLSRKYINSIDISSFTHSFLRDSDGENLEEYSEYLAIAYCTDILKTFLTREISFTDQLFLPATVANISLPSYPHVFVDEGQDLSRIEQNILRQVVSTVPKGRLVAVGDIAQAIYAFKGADPESFRRLSEDWNATKLELSTSFRCSHAVTREAQKYDDRIRAWDQSPEGSVTHKQPGTWSFTELGPDTAVLCRMNHPLVEAAISCIRNHVSVEFLGRDLANQLADFFALHSKGMKSLTGFYLNLSTLLAEKENKSEKEADRFRDQMHCIRAIADFYGVEELQELAFSIERFFQMEGNIKLATIHKAKGLEWTHVALLRPDLCPSPRAETPQELQQEHNMLYVAITRAKLSFTYLHSKE